MCAGGALPSSAERARELKLEVQPNLKFNQNMLENLSAIDVPRRFHPPTRTRRRLAHEMSTAEIRATIRAEVRALNELNSRIVAECHQKCVPKPRDGELAIAEMACVDRCVPKFVETLALVTKELEAARAPADAAAPTPR